MADMLVHLLKLPSAEPLVDTLKAKGIILRRANTFELSRLRRFAETHFSESWADEIQAGFANKPVTIYIAIRSGQIIGFASYECTRRAFFGPTGVSKPARGNGVGTALLLLCLHGLKEMGYAYAFIGGAGPTDFYTRACGAVAIEGSTPGIYADLLKKQEKKKAAKRAR